MNLQQATDLSSSAKESVKSAEESRKKLDALLVDYEAKWVGINAKIGDSTEYARVIPNVSAALALAFQNQYVPVLELAIQDLLDLREKRPTDPKISFYLGRAYKLQKKFRQAVEAMTFFIDVKPVKGEKHHHDVADAFYNRACYQSLLLPRTRDANAQGALQSAIIADVEECCRRDQTALAAIEDPRGDADFNPVRNKTWFRAALAKLHDAGY